MSEWKTQAQAITELSSVNDLMVKSKEFRSLLVNPRFTTEERDRGYKGACRTDSNSLTARSNLSCISLRSG